MIYNITSRSNPEIKHLSRLGRELSYRREHKLMLCEGEKMLTEALNAGVTPRHVVFSSEPKTVLSLNSKLIKVPADILASMTRLDSPPRLLFTVPIQEPCVEKLTGGAHIILDRVQDPGNVGSIIRTARALGISSVILSAGCADVTNPKTLRATMGAVFSQHVMNGTPEEILDAIGDYKCFSTGLRSDAITLGKAGLKNCAVVIGNEGAGVSDYWDSFDMLTIPIEFESLGAASAASIIMWEMRKCSSIGSG